MNILNNQLGIFILALFLLVATIGVSIVSRVSENIYNTTNGVYSELGINASSNTVFKNHADDAISLVISGMDFIVVVIVVLTLYSSFVSQNSISSYLLYFIASVVLSSVLIYIFHNIYNTFVLSLPSVGVNLNTFSNFLWVNFDNIIILNLVAFLLSFIFRKVRST